MAFFEKFIDTFGHEGYTKPQHIFKALIEFYIVIWYNIENVEFTIGDLL